MYPCKANSYNDMTSLKTLSLITISQINSWQEILILKINPNMFEMIHVDITLQLIQGNCT